MSIFSFSSVFLIVSEISFVSNFIFKIFKHRKKPEISDFIDFFHNNFCTFYHCHMAFQIWSFSSTLLHFTLLYPVFLHLTTLYFTRLWYLFVSKFVSKILDIIHKPILFFCKKYYIILFMFKSYSFFFFYF